MNDAAGARRGPGRARFLTWAAACAALGLAMSIGIAWLGAGFANQPGTAPGATLVVKQGRTSVPARPVQKLLPGRPETRYEMMEAYAQARGQLLERAQYTIMRIGEDGKRELQQPLDVYRAGWPSPALEWTDLPWIWTYNAAPPDRGVLARVWESGITYRAATGPSDNEAWRRLPVRPANGGLGLAVDSLVWGTVAGAGLAMGGIVRRQRRRSRGLCVRCGYPVRDSTGVRLGVCPECGEAVQRPAMPETGSPA